MTYADGKDPVLGKVSHVAQLVFRGAGGGVSVYDANRDVIQFMPYMIQQMLISMRDRRVPKLIDDLADMALERQCVDALVDIADRIGKVDHKLDFSAMAAEWTVAHPPQAVDVVLKLLGRAVLQFYVECLGVIASETPPPTGWLNSISETIFTIRAQEAHKIVKKPWWKRLFKK